ncbi:MAG: Ig-like domain-containing protein, partial [Clostridia bacterium]|nr:Ig-like domain-containing protein [Clostridia bacterium]
MSTKRFKFVVFVMLSIALLLLTSCQEDDLVTREVRLDETELALFINDEYQLIVEVKDQNGNLLDDLVEWLSSDPDTVMVEDGLVTALKIGTANITASLETGESAKCVITVSEVPDPEIPILVLDKERLEIPFNDSLSVKAEVLFKGQYYSDLEVDFSVVDESVASVTNAGVVTGLKANASTTLVVKVDWQEYELEETIEIFVKNVIQVGWLNEGSSATVYTSELVDGFSMETSVLPSIIVNGIKIENPNVVYEIKDKNGEVSTLVSIDENGVITANNTGRLGSCNITYQYIYGEKTYTSEPFTIEVAYSILDMSDEAIDIEIGVDENHLQKTSVVFNNELLNLDNEVLYNSIIDEDGNELTYLDGKIENITEGEKLLTLYTDKHYIIKARIVFCTLIISDVSELNQMTSILEASKTEAETFTYSGTEYTVYSYHGYFILDMNIDYRDDYFVGPTIVRYADSPCFAPTS